jgi:hypothetical protein
MPVARAEELSLVPSRTARSRAGDAASRDASERCSHRLRRCLAARARRAAQLAWHRGPGWFDSSWELRSGCEFREGWPADATLREWIEGWLYPARGASFNAT